jgi:hypothetical protein
MDELKTEPGSEQRVAVVPEPPPEQERVGKGYRQPRATTLSGILPCGAIGPDGTPYEEFLVREMTGVEEDLLMGSGSMLARLNGVIMNCLVGLGPWTAQDPAGQLAIRKAVPHLPGMDRMVLLIALRRVSLGDLFDMQATCPNCGRTATYAVDLAALEVTPMPDRRVRTFEDTLPSGVVARWHIMTSMDEEWLAKVGKRSAKGAPVEDRATMGMLARVDAVDGVALDRVRDLPGARGIVRGMSLRDRNWLRDHMQGREGGIDDSVEHTCSACEHEWVGDLEVGQAGFFFPSGTRGR